MSSYQDSKVKFNGAIDKLSEEIDKLTKKAQRATELEAQNQKLQENNSHLENEIKILKSDFMELNIIAGNISSQLDENIYTIKDILDS